MTSEEIIAKFELQVDDTTELSSEEELDLLNDVYQDVCDDRPWEFLKTNLSETTNGSASISLPTNFSYFVEMDGDGKKIVWVGGVAYWLINYQDRRNYVDQDGVCYVDGDNLTFVVAPDSGLTVESTYIKIPEDLEIDTSPIFPARFHKMLAYAMAINDLVIQGGDDIEVSSDTVAKNSGLYNVSIGKMRYYNARLTNI